MAALAVLVPMAMLPTPASATHNDNYFASQSVNQPGQALGSYTTSHTSLGAAAATNPGAAETCGTIWFGADVWYDFHPHRNGRIRINVIGPAGSNYEPVVGVFKYNLSTGLLLPFEPATCQASTPGINRAVFPAEGFHAVTAGLHYKIQIGGANKPNASQANGGVPWTGNYQLFFTYDPDTDGDGLYDGEDRCDSAPGARLYAGCPDNDRDNLVFPDDDCPNGAGLQKHRGCPDPDRDDIVAGDECPSEFGKRENGGCPDKDGDGRIDKRDACPSDSASARDEDGNGCLDLHDLVYSKFVPRALSERGVVVNYLTLYRVPRGARIEITCRRPRRPRSCGHRVIRKATKKTIKLGFLSGKRLPFGTKLIVRVTKRGATGAYISYGIARRRSKPFKLTERCTNHGSTRLRRSGCT